MAKEYQQGRYILRNPQKYKGDPNNVIFRSSWERRFMIFLDCHDAILTWSSEEIPIPYHWPLDGKTHYYFPDFFVTMQTKKGIVNALIEIKPHEQTIAPKRKNKRAQTFLHEVETYAKNQIKWKAAEEFCKQRNWVFKVITEKDLFKKVVW